MPEDTCGQSRSAPEQSCYNKVSLSMGILLICPHPTLDGRPNCVVNETAMVFINLNLCADTETDCRRYNLFSRCVLSVVPDHMILIVFGNHLS